MCDDPPEIPVIRTLDFSQFHPLDHYLLECRGYPGGWRRHLGHRWDFQWKDKLRGWTLCRSGRHKWVTWYRDGKLLSTVCAGCGKEKA